MPLHNQLNTHRIIMQVIAKKEVQIEYVKPTLYVSAVLVLGAATLSIGQFDESNYCLEIDIDNVQGTQVIGFTIDERSRVIEFSGCHSWHDDYVTFLEENGFVCSMM